MFDIGYLKSNVRLGQHNNSLNTMIRGRMMGIEIAQSPTDQIEWSIEGGNHAICTFLYEHKADGLILKFNNHKPIAREFNARYWTYIEAYLDTVPAKSKIKKKDLLFILPREFDDAPTLGQINNKGKADKNGSLTIHHIRIWMIIKQFKTDKSICQDWTDICNCEEREVIAERENLLDINTMAPEIAITGYDVWIEKWLDDSALQESLMRTKTTIQEGWDESRSNQRLEIYTDRSLTKTRCNNMISHYKSDSHHISMGAGVYIRDHLDCEFKIMANIRNWPSSTRTEICTILIALIAVPVLIYIDSQCVIDNITIWNKKSAQAKEKTTNHCILFRIAQIIKEKMINLEVIKVKGHSNIAGNEKADRSVAERSNSNLRFTYRIDHSSQEFRYILTYDKIPIEESLKKFITQLLNTYNAIEWSLLQCNRELCHTNNKQVAWKVTWNLLNQLRGFRCRSSKCHFMLVFIVKMLHKCLPIGSILAQRRSDLYKQYRCLAYQNDNIEDWEHLLACRGYDDTWNSIHDKLTIEFKIIGQKELKDNKAMLTRLNAAITELLGRQANSAKFCDFVKLSIEVKCD
ncbi:hypothetical protein RclHR1_07510009 [Rhizophagus clarus]|uniref:RNase H type-1 domain-containing protein n=1 Tax=Rhizophagus clarus TaxID=94130 RepID=A0A2Z6S3M6_9GLOM|nr:hypothetical protein RclHR1_07510009 [Rhizophagus clarus]